MEFPNYDITKPPHAVVGSCDCIVCGYKGRKNKADILNSSGGELYCRRCGKISIGYWMENGRKLSPNSMMARTIAAVAPILDFLGSTPKKDSWEFIHLTGSRCFMVQRKIDGHYVKLDFEVTYDSDVDVAQRTRTDDPQFAGRQYDAPRYQRQFSKPLPPGIAKLFEKLAAEQFGMWSIYQSWGDTRWIKGDWHWFSQHHAGIRAIRLYVSWR